MRRVNIDSIQIGVKLARTIFNSDGGVLLTKGSELKDSYIEKLKKYGVSEIYLDDELSADLVIEDVMRDQTRNEAVVLVKKNDE